MLQCVAVCCRVLPCVAVCCRVLPCVAVCCDMVETAEATAALVDCMSKEPYDLRGRVTP